MRRSYRNWGWPAERIASREAIILRHLPEALDPTLIIRLLFEGKSPGISQEVFENARKPFTEFLDCRSFLDSLEPVVLRLCFGYAVPDPGETTRR